MRRSTCRPNWGERTTAILYKRSQTWRAIITGIPLLHYDERTGDTLLPYCNAGSIGRATLADFIKI